MTIRTYRVLVLEDETFIAMSLEADLEDAGFEVIGAYATCADATSWLQADTPDAAVIDHWLRDGPCDDVVAELRNRGVPFIIFSGLAPSHLPPHLQVETVIEKPNSREVIATLVRCLTTNSDRSSKEELASE